VLFAEEGGVRAMKARRTLMTTSQHGCVNGLPLSSTHRAVVMARAAVVRPTLELWQQAPGMQATTVSTACSAKGWSESAGVLPSRRSSRPKKDELCRPLCCARAHTVPHLTLAPAANAAAALRI
jgi:hypothetical protein